MRTLNYWVCDHVENRRWNVRAKTKKEALRKKEENGASMYGEPKKVKISYFDLVDLVNECGGGHWEDY